MALAVRFQINNLMASSSHDGVVMVDDSATCVPADLLVSLDKSAKSLPGVKSTIIN